MLLLDSCVLINLLATGRLQEIAAHFPSPGAVCSLVKSEALFLRNPSNAENPKEPVDLSSFIVGGILTEVALGTPAEKDLFVNLAAELDDGEAMAMAIALARGDFVATDERKAAKVFVDFGGDATKLRTTPDLLKAWAEGGGRAPDDVRMAIALIRTRANYQPPTSHPLRAWWLSFLNPGGT